MKKLLLLLLLVCLGISSQAQQRPSLQGLDGNRLQNFLQNARQNNLPTTLPPLQASNLQQSLGNSISSSSLDKKWQVLIILNTGNLENWGAVDDSRKELFKHFKANHVEKAILFYSRKDGSSFLNIFKAQPAHREKGANTSDEPQYAYRQVDLKKYSSQEVLNYLVKQLQSSPHLYTAMLFKAHGNGHHMKVAMKTTDEKPFITIFHLINALKQNHVKVDLLDLVSCYMGTMSNVHHLLTGSDVKYLITSSNFALSENTQNVKINEEWVKASTGPLALITNLDKTPKEAALQTALAKYKQGISFVHNIMVVDGDVYRQQVAPAVDKWVAASRAGKFQIPTSTFAKGMPGFAMLHLLRDISKEERANANVRSANKNLASVLITPILSYQCYNPYSNQAYTQIEAVPYGNPCIAGFSVDNEVIKELDTHQVTPKSFESLNRLNELMNRLEREGFSSQNNPLYPKITQPTIERNDSFYSEW